MKNITGIDRFLRLLLGVLLLQAALFWLGGVRSGDLHQAHLDPEKMRPVFQEDGKPDLLGARLKSSFVKVYLQRG